MSSTTEHTEENNWAYDEFTAMAINCRRMIKRFIRTMATLSRKINEPIAAASDTKAEAKAFYRLIGNEKVTEEVVLNAHRKATIQQMEESSETSITFFFLGRFLAYISAFAAFCKIPCPYFLIQESNCNSLGCYSERRMYDQTSIIRIR